MKTLITKIENKIEQLENVLRNDPPLEEGNIIYGRITQLEWVLDEIDSLTDEEDSNVIGGVDFSDSLDMLNNL